MISMDSDEKRLKQEDCNEDELGTGVLTLTNNVLHLIKERVGLQTSQQKWVKL